MFEKEIKFIADFNLNKVKSFGAFITFERLLKSSIHPAVIQYISAELDYLISGDRNRLLGESVFDYSSAETAKYFNLIAQEIKKSKEISFEDLKKLVIQGVSFNLNYLARPKWSLSKLIYNEEQNKPVEDIKLNLNYIYFYDYIKSIFLSYISKRKLTTLSVTEFELILNKIDNELFSAQPQKLVDYSLYSMAEFFNLGDVSKTKINVLTLELFLKEKNLMDYLFRLRKAVPDDINRKYDIDDIKDIIYSSVPINAPVKEPELKIPEKEDFQADGKTEQEVTAEDFSAQLDLKDETVFPEDSNEEEIIEEEIPGKETDDEITGTESEPKTGSRNNDPVIEEEAIEEKIIESAGKDIPGQKNEEKAESDDLDSIITEHADTNELPEEEVEDKQEEENIDEVENEQIEEITEPAEKVVEPAEEKKEPLIEEPIIEEPSEDDITAEYIPGRLEEEEAQKNRPEETATEDELIPEETATEDELIPEETNDDPVKTLTDEEFFAMFSDEVKKIEENDADLKSGTDDFNEGETKKEEVDSFLDFEEETENLLRAFKETEDELNAQNIDLFSDSTSKTDKAAMDLIKDFHENSFKDEKSDEKDIPVPPANENNDKPKRNGRYKEKKLRNIIDSISNNDIEKIISNVFNEDKKDFTDTMEKLNECKNYDEATEILKSVFVTYRVNPYTRDALTLTNSVANYFTKV